MTYAFINHEGLVVNQIVGDLSEAQLARFLADQRALFGAESFVIVGDDRAVWIGGSYDSDSGVFSPPPSPEPEIVEGTSEEIIEEIAEEPTNDAA
jgi:hypothetical protein